MNSGYRNLWTRFFGICLLASFFCSSVQSQNRVNWPEKGKNLKVLPKDIDKQELRRVMISFSVALGVNCYHCHTNSDRNDFSTYDFADDGKETKRIAREMFKMVSTINEKELPRTGRAKAGLRQVNCVTCHRGVNKPPLPLEDELAAVIAADGVQAGIERYHELREQHFGGFAYNFGENSLNALGYQLLGAEKIDDAIEIFKLNIAMYPDASNPYDSLGEAYMKAGKKWLAIINYSKSLELNPRNRNAETMLEKLTGDGSGDADSQE